MKLIKGVQVHCYDDQTEDRLFLSNGMTLLGDHYQGFECRQGAFKPKKPWKTPSKEERELIFSNQLQLPDYRQAVGVVKLPDAMIRIAEKMQLATIKSEDELRVIKKEQTYDYMELTAGIDDFVDGYTLDEYNIHKIGVHLGNPGFEVGTVDGDSNKLIGLHIDSWDKLPLHKIDVATNRICFNLGSEDRYFLFVNQTLANIMKLLNAQDVSLPTLLSGYNRRELLDGFFRLCATYPVIRLRIKPYEAYIAPTENIIHDGDLANKVNPDVTYTIRGYFDVVSKQTQTL